MRSEYVIGLVLGLALGGGGEGAARQTSGDWPQFRGPGGLSVSREKGLPVTWSADRNVAWTVELPHRAAERHMVAEQPPKLLTLHSPQSGGRLPLGPYRGACQLPGPRGQGYQVLTFAAG